MNRTKEFISIVKATQIPQWNAPSDCFYKNITFTEGNSIKEIEKNIEILKSIKLDEKCRNDRKEFMDGFGSIIRQRILEWTLKKKQIERNNLMNNKTSNSVNLSQNTNDFKLNSFKGNNFSASSFNRNTFSEDSHLNNHPPNSMQFSQQSAVILEEESVIDRRQSAYQNQTAHQHEIAERITEMGQIVESIYIQVGIQEEKLKGISDLVDNTEYFGKKIKYELEEIWENMSGRRKNIVKFFFCWVFLIFIFWFIRR